MKIAITIAVLLALVPSTAMAVRVPNKAHTTVKTIIADINEENGEHVTGHSVYCPKRGLCIATVSVEKDGQQLVCLAKIRVMRRSPVTGMRCTALETAAP